MLARARALPAVQQAALTFPAPFDTYDRRMGFYVDGPPGPRDGTIGTEGTFVSDGIVDDLGLELVAGRDLLPSDSAGAPRVMVVSRSLAARLWPGKDPICQRARRHNAQGEDVTVVGSSPTQSSSCSAARARRARISR